ncbi:Crp/Fnr family transcriptional regulator [Trinickia dinghuensis]|uniref:Crp/Fnr family transcriptional regulator n=1 Tax=Trinickia dinghuensis TaxID=2291023 RepID=A0A3D8JYH7_9BURK|nr:Crp/Fnr family transcriptional regulator [Trinickia dinghuensis]RDU97421.1 Crp/Fnr family transcriptional regulator [Trinickia dinghuensis]
MNQQRTSWTRTAAPGEVIYSEGFAGEAVLYVITEGKVELSTRCDDKKVVLATVGKGEFFGEAVLLQAEPRAHTAKALSFCQLTVIHASMVEEELERASPLLRHIVRTTIRRSRKKDDLLATYTHADFLPGVVSYAHVLALMAGTDNADSMDGRMRRGQTDEVSVPLPEVIKKCRAIAGHSRPHVMTMLGRMEKLNLVSLGTGRAEHLSGNSRGGDAPSNRHVVTFDPTRITERAQQVADQDLDIAINSELELIELADLEALIGVERKMLLNKLSHDEIAEDVFAFRKTKVLHYVEEKGVSYFAKRARGSGDVKSLEDIEFVDHRTLFDAVSATDTYDLAKLAASAGDPAIVDKLFSVMTEARKKEVSWVMRRDLKIDQAEVEDIEQRFLQTIRELKVANSHAPMSREA